MGVLMNIKDCKVSAETMAHISKAIFAGLKNVKIEYVKFNSKYNNGLGLSILNNIFEEIDILSTSIIVKSYQRGSYIFPIIYDVNTKTIITLASINVLDRLLHRKEIINPHYIDALLMENHELEGNYQQESMFDDDYVDE